MNEESVFHLALEKLPGERGAFLTQVCAGDPTLRERVEVLLQVHENPASFLEQPALESTPLKAFVEQLTAELQADSSSHFSVYEVDGGQLPDSTFDFLARSDDPEFLGRLDHYHIHEIVGRGGMGIVLRAFDETLHRVVAIKVMAPELAASAEARQRFVREARAAAAVSHDHVVTIHAVGEWKPPHTPSGTLPYLAMQLVAGESLQRRIDRAGTLSLREIVRIGMQTASGLAAAHAQGLVHLDVKPANILLENGIERVKITDFGLARAADSAHLTQIGVVAGTPQYMSPEQARGEAVDHRADLFSLGSVLYAMCTAHSPFRADSTIATLRSVSDDTPRPIKELNPDIPDWFVGVVDKLLAKDPAERFQSAAEVADLLGQYLKHLQEPSATPKPDASPSSNKKSALRTTGRLTRRRRFAAAAAIFLLLSGLGWTEATGVTQVADFVGSVLRITTPEGTLIVEVDDPQTKVTIDGDELRIEGAGPREIRLRPGQYKFSATKDGKPLREELVTISRGDKQVVKVSLEGKVPSTAGTTIPAERQAFVIMGGKGFSERKFDTLIEAVAGARPGDNIEVRGNGPFLTPPVKIGIGDVVIRAAAGFHPVIGLNPNSAAEHEPLLRCTGPLTLEGLELQRLNQTAWKQGETVPSIISTEGNALNIANCRFRSDIPARYRLYCIATEAADVRVRNCEFYIPAALSISTWSRNIELDNCLHLGRLALSFDSTKGRGNIRINRNTLVGNKSQLIHAGFGRDVETLGDVGAGEWVKLAATGNIFDSLYVLQFGEADIRPKPIERDAAEAIFRRALTWTGKENVYTASRFFFTWSHGMKVLPNHGPQDLESWRKFWSSPETGSVTGRVHYQGGDLIARLLDEPEKLTPDDFRLRADSAGYRAGSDGKDLGADVDLVGPGPAYERWKKTPQHRQWLKDTNQLARYAAASAELEAFVVLGGKGVPERKFDSLIEAVHGASSGDCIEVRGNGPFLTPPVRISIGTLTIRAAAGFRPVIGLSPNSAPEHEPLLRSNGPLTLEGLELQRLNQPAWKMGETVPSIISTGGDALYVANCRFRSELPVLNRPYPLYCIGTDAAVFHVRNCEFYIPDSLAISTWSRNVVLDNCLHLGRLGLSFDAMRARSNIRISRNTMVTNKSQLIHVYFGVDLDTLGDAGAGTWVTLETIGNIFDSLYVLQFGEGDFRPKPIEPDTAEAIFRRVLAWTGRENVYTARQFFFLWTQGRKDMPNHGPQDLEGWRKFWNSPETGSVEGRIRYQGGDLVARLMDEPEKLTPEDFRLRADSAGYRAGNDGKDLGADVDLVGPGPAYERWKKTPQYQDWLNETGQLSK